MRTARTLAVLLVVVCVPSTKTRAQPEPKQTDPVIATVLDRVIRESERERATGIVVGSLFAQYEQEHELEGSDAQIQAFVESNRESRKRHVQEREERAAAFRVELASPDLSNEEREKRRARLELLEKLLKSDAEVESYRKEYPGKIEAGEREAAKQFVRRWNLNRSLYERYGGRVIFQQAGPEPVDAYRIFLQEQQKKGAFQLLDPVLRQEFWRYFVDDEMHSFLPEDVGKKAMAKPWWLMDEPLDE